MGSSRKHPSEYKNHLPFCDIPRYPFPLKLAMKIHVQFGVCGFILDDTGQSNQSSHDKHFRIWIWCSLSVCLSWLSRETDVFWYHWSYSSIVIWITNLRGVLSFYQVLSYPCVCDAYLTIMTVHQLSPIQEAPCRHQESGMDDDMSLWDKWPIWDLSCHSNKSTNQWTLIWHMYLLLLTLLQLPTPLEGPS